MNIVLLVLVILAIIFAIFALAGKPAWGGLAALAVLLLGIAMLLPRLIA